MTNVSEEVSNHMRELAKKSWEKRKGKQDMAAIARLGGKAGKGKPKPRSTKKLEE